MAEEIYMRRRGFKLEPITPYDEEALYKFAEGCDLTVTIKRPRSNKQHRFFWGLLQKVCENHDVYRQADQLLLWLKVRMGYVEEVRFHNEKVWWVAKSTNYNSMPQDEFRKFFDEALDIIVTEVIPDLNKEELVREVENMLHIKLSDVWKESKCPTK
jgi:hypothetical protein